MHELHVHKKGSQAMYLTPSLHCSMQEIRIYSIYTYFCMLAAYVSTYVYTYKRFR